MTDTTRPEHYTKNAVTLEPIALLERAGFLWGSMMKYLIRYEDKGEAYEDLCKALWYCDRWIDNAQRGDWELCKVPSRKVLKLFRDIEMVDWFLDCLEDYKGNKLDAMECFRMHVGEVCEQEEPENESN